MTSGELGQAGCGLHVLQLKLSSDFLFSRYIPMIVLAVISVILPAVMILATVIWGWKNGTLSETDQDRYDWDFERIVNRI